jgi:hypothetical protein
MAISPSRDSKLHRAHLAQVHPHRIVGAVCRGGGVGFALHHAGLRAFGNLGGVFGLFFGFHHVDAHVGEQRHDVLDLLRRNLVRRQHLVELVIGHEAALLRKLDHLLDAGIGQVEHRAVAAAFRRLGVFRSCLLGHCLLLACCCCFACLCSRHSSCARSIWGVPPAAGPNFLPGSQRP